MPFALPLVVVEQVVVGQVVIGLVVVKQGAVEQVVVVQVVVVQVVIEQVVWAEQLVALTAEFEQQASLVQHYHQLLSLLFS